MLFLTIVDSEIELVPEEIAKHPLIRSRARKRRKDPTDMLLDSNSDYKAMAALPDGRGRGRPDIAHICLLNAMDSISSREGHLKVYVHTRHDIVLGFENRTRIPRTQARFYGLLESILSEERSTDLISFRKISLKELREEIAPDMSLGFSSRGEPIDLPSEMGRGERILAMVGGFPSGDFRSPVKEVADKVVRCYGQPLDAWTVVNEVICAFQSKKVR